MFKLFRLWDDVATAQREFQVTIHHPNDIHGVRCNCEKGQKGSLCHHRLALFSVLGYRVGETDITGHNEEPDLVVFQSHLTEYEFGEVNHR